MITGKRPTDPMFKDGLNLVNFVDENFPHRIDLIIDARLKEDCKDVAEAKMENVIQQCLSSLLQVALSCAQPLPINRMNMKDVAGKLQETRTTYLGWKSKK